MWWAYLTNLKFFENCEKPYSTRVHFVPKMVYNIEDRIFEVKKVPLGQGHIYSFSMHDFTRVTIQYFKRDIYAWLDQEPESKPYLD